MYTLDILLHIQKHTLTMQFYCLTMSHTNYSPIHTKPEQACSHNFKYVHRGSDRYTDAHMASPRHTSRYYRNLTRHLSTCQHTLACPMRASLAIKKCCQYTMLDHCYQMCARISKIHQVWVMLRDFLDKFFRISHQEVLTS